MENKIFSKEPTSLSKLPKISLYKLEHFSDMEFGTHVIKSAKGLHSHDFWEFSYVLKGSVKHYVNFDYTETLTPGYLLIFRPSDIHSFDDINEVNCNHRDILFSTRLFKEICDFVNTDIYNNLLSSPAPISIPLSEENEKDLEELLNNFNSIDSSKMTIKYSIAKSIGAYLLILYNFYICFKTEKYSKEFNKLLSILKSPSVLQKGIPELVKKAGYSHGHLCRLFTKSTGKTLLFSLTKYRMLFAASLLKNTDIGLDEISTRVGYESISHFISTFRSFHGITPHKYKNQFTKVKSNKQFTSTTPLNTFANSDAYVALGNFLQEKRINAPIKYTIEELAEKLGLSINFYENVEKGLKLNFGTFSLNLFAKTVELSPHDKEELFKLYNNIFQTITSDVEIFLIYTEIGNIIQRAIHETMSGRLTKIDWQNFTPNEETIK